MENWCDVVGGWGGWGVCTTIFLRVLVMKQNGSCRVNICGGFCLCDLICLSGCCDHVLSPEGSNVLRHQKGEEMFGKQNRVGGPLSDGMLKFWLPFTYLLYLPGYLNVLHTLWKLPLIYHLFWMLSLLLQISISCLVQVVETVEWTRVRVMYGGHFPPGWGGGRELTPARLWIQAQTIQAHERTDPFLT